MATVERELRASNLACVLSEACDMAGDPEVVLEALGITLAGLLCNRPRDERGQIVDEFIYRLPDYVAEMERAS